MATLDTILNIRVEGTDQMVKLKTEIDKTAAELKELQTDGKKASETQDQFNAKVVTAETKLKAMRGELTKSKTELIKNAKAAGDSSKSYNSLTKANAKLSAEVRKLADPMGKNKKAFTELTGKMKANEAQLKKMDAAMGRNQRNVGNYKQSLTSVATGIGAVIIAFKTFQRVLGTFVDFQFQMKQVGVISGATTVELEMLTETAKELGSTTAFTAGEVAGLQTELAKLGFDPTEIDGMTSSVLDLAFAFDKDLAQTGETVAVVLKSYQMEASEAGRVTDILATAFASTSLDLEKFNTAFPKVGAISKQLGFSLEGTTAMLGQLTSVGLEASTAGTSLRSIFLKLADSNSALSQKLGGSVKSVDQLLPALNKLYEEGTDVEEMLGLTDKRAVTAFASLAAGATDVAVLTDSFKDSEGAAADMAAVMRDTLKGSLDETTSAANGFVIELFEKLEPAILLVVEGIGLLFEALGFLLENLGKVALGVGAYAAVVGIAAIGNGTFVTSLMASKVALGLQAAAAYISKTATNAFSTAIKMNPIGLFIGLLTTGIALLLDWGAASDEAADSQQAVVEPIKEQVKELSKLDKIKKDSMSQQTKEIASLKALVGQIKAGNLSTKERGKAIKEYNAIAGTNISNLSSEETIVKNLEKSYTAAVDAIKRKIILQSSEKSVIALLEKQAVLEEEIEQRKIFVNNATENQLKTDKKLVAINKERQEAGARTTEALIADGDNLLNNTIRVNSTAEQSNVALTNSVALMIEENQQRSETSQMYSDQRIVIMQQEEIANENAAIATVDSNERIKTSNEDKTLSVTASADAAIAANIANGDAVNILNEEKLRLSNTEGQHLKLEEQIAAIYAKADGALAKLNVSSSHRSKSNTAAKTEYQLLKDAVGNYITTLQSEIVNGTQAMDAFVNSEEAKAMSAEDKGKRIAKIEADTAVKVKKATDDVIKAKSDLKVIDDQLATAFKVINATSVDYISKLQKVQVETEKQIAIDNRQLGTLQDLEDAGANVAKERITLALKIAQTELTLALKTAEASDLSTQAQIDNIARLKGEIEGFQEELADTEGTGGFMNKMLFGTNEEGGAFTGEDLINSVQMGLETTAELMSSFNALQQQQLAGKLGVIEKDKKAAVKLYKESAEFEVATDKERAKRIEEIEKTHDDKMLALKIAQFKKDQQMQRAQAIIGGATAIMNILKGSATGNVIADAIIKGVLIAATIATTAMQIATINATPPPTAALGGVMDDSFFKMGGMVNGKSHAQGGEKFSVGGRVAELEGGEAVINKKSTAMFKPMLSQMNVAGGGKKFADGGMVFADGGMTFETDTLQNDNGIADALLEGLQDQQVLLVEAEVTDSQKDVAAIESRISF